MGGHDGAVAGKGQADGFGEAVHGIGGEHAGAAAASGAGRRFNGGYFGIVLGRVGRLDHRVNQVQTVFSADTGFHRSAGHENGGDVQPHGGHQHTGRNLVAVADADHRIGLVGVYHIFYAVGNDIPRGEGVEHSVVSHGNAIIHGDGVEFGRKAAQFADFFLDQLPDFVQVGVAGNKLREGVDHGNDRLAHLVGLHSGRVPERPGSGHPPAFEGDRTSEWMLHNVYKKTFPAAWTGKVVISFGRVPYSLPGPGPTRIRTIRDRIIRLHRFISFLLSEGEVTEYNFRKQIIFQTIFLIFSILKKF